MNSDTKQISFFKTASTFGLVMGLVSSAIHFSFYLVENVKISPLISIFVNITAVCLVLVFGTRIYRNNIGGYITYWQAFRLGIWIFLFAGIVGAVYSYIFNSIDPDYAFRQIGHSTAYLQESLIDEKLKDLGSASKEVVDSVKNAVKLQVAEFAKISKEAVKQQVEHPFRTIFQSAIWNMAIGAIFCFISSAFLKKNRPTLY